MRSFFMFLILTFVSISSFQSLEAQQGGGNSGCSGGSGGGNCGGSGGGGNSGGGSGGGSR